MLVRYCLQLLVVDFILFIKPLDLVKINSNAARFLFQPIIETIIIYSLLSIFPKNFVISVISIRIL